jgi:hypothetical protein
MLPSSGIEVWRFNDATPFFYSFDSSDRIEKAD